MTLVELLVTLIAGALVIAGIFRLLLTTNSAYTTQEQLVDVNLNTQFASEYLSEALTQAGADLPTEGMEVLITRPSASTMSDTVTIKVNPTRAVASPLSDVAIGATQIPVLDAAPFAGDESLAIEHVLGAVTRVKLSSVNTAATPNLLVLADALTVTVWASAKIYGFSTEKYYRNGTDLCLNSTGSVIAEGITKLECNYLDTAGAGPYRTCPWFKVKFARLNIAATMTNGKMTKTAETFVTFRNR